MRLVLFVLLTLFVAIVVTIAAIENPGYVLIARAPWSIEMPLTLFVPLLLVGGFVVYLFVYGLVRLMRIPRDVARWRTRRQVRRARTAMAYGFIKLIDGDFAAAEAELIAGLRHGELPLLNYLAAAYCAQEQGMIEKRDEYLANAQRNAEQHASAVSMMQARLQQSAHQNEQALATLTELRQSQPRNRYLLRLLVHVYQELRDWTGLAELTPELRSQGALPHTEIDALELRAHKELLQLSLPSGSQDVLARAWNAVPKPLRRHPGLLAIYVRQLIQQNEMQEAESVLRAALDDQWDSELAALYGQVYGEHPGEQLAHAESWLSSHPDDAGLHLACARLALHTNDLAKSRTYFDKCIALNGPTDAYRELGALLERLGEKDKATTVYRRGLDAQAAERPNARRNSNPPPRYKLVR
jgi:HemY protein